MLALAVVSDVGCAAVEQQSDRHAMRAERAILGRRACTRPRRLVIVDPELDPVGYRTPHRGTYPELAASLGLHPAVLEVANTTREHARLRQTPDHRRAEDLSQQRDDLSR
jgi:hypothetical protein